MTVKIAWTSSKVSAVSLLCHMNNRKVTDDKGQRICTNNTRIRLDLIEPTILDEVLRLALDSERFTQFEDSETRVALAEVKRQIEFKSEQCEKLADNLADTVSPTMMKRLTRLEGEVADLQAEQKKLARKVAAQRGNRASPSMIRRIAETRTKLTSDDPVTRMEARSMVSDALRNVISDILCYEDKTVMVIIAQGIAAFRLDGLGKVTWRFDGSGDARLVHGVTSGSFADNAKTVADIVKRAKATPAKKPAAKPRRLSA